MHFFFGFVSYIVPIPIFAGLYFLYKDNSFHIRKVEITLAVILVYIALIMAQELTLEAGSQIGYIISETIVPVTGIAGFVIVNLLVLIIALYLLFNLSFTHFDKLIEIVAKMLPKKEVINIRKAIFADEEHEKLIRENEKKKPEEEENPTEKREEIIEELKEEFKEELLEEEKDEVTESDHRQSIEEYIAQKKKEIQQIDSSAIEDSSARKVNIVVESVKRANEEKAHEEQVEAKKEEAKKDTIKEFVVPEIKEEKPFFEVSEVDEEEKEPVKIPEKTLEKVKEEKREELSSVKEEKQEEIVKKEPPVDLGKLDEETLDKPSYERKTNVKIVKELEENKKILENIDIGEVEKPKDFQLPSTKMLQSPKATKSDVNEAEIDAKIEDLLEKLRVFKIEGDIVRTYAGPVVTTFEFKPAPHIKVSKILNLQDDIAMALRAQTIRIQAPIPGKDVVGIEIPNISIETIYLREILESELFNKASSPLTIVLGKDIVGNAFITDLRKLPHLLIAGTTGSGKSVGINAMILSLLYKNSPDKLKFLMVDPKMLEFSIYNDIPHLLTPVITQPKQAINAMANMVIEMDRRYALMAKTKTKTIESFNEKAKKEGLEHMPFIVVIIDELADLMMAGGKEVEVSIARLAQKARACGIHLIIATQRPSTDVITGLIKANLPSRLSYRVGSKIDSKVILDQMGADALLGRGDLLFTPPGSVGLVRVHAPWSTEEEIDDIAEFLKHQREVEYDHAFLDEGGDLAGDFPAGSEASFKGQLDELYGDAKEIVITEKKTSISYIQRKLGIGYNRSANIIEQLEKTGVLSAPNSKGQREVVGS